jgi:hypothetical protein
MAQQLFARIKKTSKYYGQGLPGDWFDVEIEHNLGPGQHSIRGNNNLYRREDVTFGVRIESGMVVQLK